MRKKLSGLSIFFMLLVKHPPVSPWQFFHKISIVEVRGFRQKKVALEFNIN